MTLRSQRPLSRRQAVTVQGYRPAVIPYEKQLDRDPRWALSEASLYFEGKGAVQQALQKITRRLHELGIPYTVVGGLALFQHGYRRFTEDVDILVTKESLTAIHEKLEGLGYVPTFKHSKNLRDTELGVKIKFLITGEFPGDGKPKPVAFPDPSSASITIDGVAFPNVESLIELKLASGMTNPGPAKDISDVMELTKSLNLPLAFADKLNPYVQEKFREIWRNAQKRFVLLWRNKFLTTDAKSLDEMANLLQAAADELRAMLADGVTLDPDGGTGDDYAHLITSDPRVAEKCGMVDESELWPESEENDARAHEYP